MGVDLATYRARIGGHYHRLLYAARSTGHVLTGWLNFWILVGTLLLITGLDPNQVITGCVAVVTVIWVILFPNENLPHSSSGETKIQNTMGVNLAAHRTWIGCDGNVVYSTSPDVTGWMIFCSFIWILLLIAGIEPNPGPKSKKETWTPDHVAKKPKIAENYTQENVSSDSDLKSSGDQAPMETSSQIASSTTLTTVQRLHTKALQTSVHPNQLPKEQERTLQETLESDTSFWKYLRELNVDTLWKHFLDFGRNQQVVSESTDFLNFMTLQTNEQFEYHIYIVNIGSCIDGSKVQQIDEVDSLAIISTEIKVEKHPHKKNRYILFNNKDEEIKALNMIERLADVIDNVARTWTPPENLKHGGFASPHYCGVRYNGPAVTLLFTYEPEPGKIVDLSVDVTLAFRVPTGYPDRQKVVEKLSPIQTALKDRLIEKEEIHFVPDVVDGMWLMSTAHIEAQLFHGLSTDVPVKLAFCLTKLISNTIKHNNSENPKVTCFPEDPHVSDILDRWKETSNAGSGDFSDIKKLMRYAHGFLSRDKAKGHHECEKHDISMNSAALKHTLLANAVENTELFRPSQNVEDDVYILVEETFRIFGLPDRLSVPHALIDNCNIGIFSLSKPALLSDKVDQLVFMMKEKCRAVHSKICTQSTESLENLQVDPRTSGIEILKQYLVPTEDIFQTCAASYIYQVQVDPSISPKRSREVKHITMMINGLQNSCGGIIAVSCDATFDEDTQKEWRDMFVKGVPSGVEHLDAMDFKVRGTLLDTLCIKPSKLKTSHVSMAGDQVQFHLRDDGWIERLVISSSPRKCTLPNIATKSDDLNDGRITRTDELGEKVTIVDMQTDKMLPRSLIFKPIPNKSRLRPTVSISYKKDRVLKQREKIYSLSPEIVKNLSIFQMEYPAHYSPPKEALTDHCDAVTEILNHIELITERNACILAFPDMFSFLDRAPSPTGLSSFPKPVLDILYLNEDCHVIITSIYNGKTYLPLCHKRTFYAGRILSKYLTANLEKELPETILKIYPYTYLLGTTELPSFQARPCGVAMPCIKMGLARLLLHDNTTYRDRVNNELSMHGIHLTMQQLDKVFGFKMIKLGVIEGPPGSGKTLLEQYLCKEFGKDKSIVFCPNKGVAAYINHYKKGRAVWNSHVSDCVNAIETTFKNHKYIIIDDVQYMEYDEKAWKQLFEIIVSSTKHLYLFMDSEYQTHRGEENVKLIRKLVAEYGGHIFPSLREIYRNSQVVVDYMEKTAFGDAEGDHFECCSPLDGDDVKLTTVHFLQGKSAQNGLLHHVKKLLASKLYVPTDVAILFEPDSKLLPLIEDIFSKFAPRIEVQKADEYPIRGLIIDELTRFEGLEAVCLIMVLEDAHKLNNSRFKTMIASRGVKRVELIQGEIVDVKKMEMLHFDPQTVADDEILREQEVNMEKELTEYDDELLHACRNGDLKFMEAALIDLRAVDQTRSRKSKITLLMTAAYWGHGKIVQWLIQKGASVNAEDDRGHTALSRASFMGHTDVVRELLERGADVEQGEEKPLIEAAESGKIELVRMLIEKGACVNVEDDDGDTALSRASGEGHIDVVRELLEHGADVEKGRWEPLIVAAGSGKLEVVRVLIEKGASVNAEDVEGYTALSRASGKGHIDVVRELLEHGADVEQGDWTSLIEAACRGKLEVVRVLIEKGASVNAEDDEGYTALYRASVGGHTDVVRELLEHGADVEQGKCTPLIEAAWRGKLEVVRVLIEKGASVNAEDVEGNTALSHVSYEGHTDVVRELLEHGADVEQGQLKPLIVAAWRGKLEVVRVLIEKGASVNVEEDDGDTALSSASGKGHIDVVRELLEHGADVEQGEPLVEAALSGKLEVVRMLIEKGADLNIVNADGDTALSKAISEGHTDTVRLLSEKGADVNVVAADGDTALIWASSKGRTGIVQLLLERGADVNVVAADGNTALISACSTGRTGIVQLLLERGADVNVVAADGDTALIKASRWGRTDIVRLLLERGADVNVVADGTTALIKASRWGRTDIVRELLERGASVNSRDAEGHTALWYVRAELESIKDYSSLWDRNRQNLSATEKLLLEWEAIV